MAGETSIAPRRSGTAAPSGKRTVLLFGRHDASVSLYFDGLRTREIEFRFHAPASPVADRRAMSAVDTVILVRDLDRYAVDGTLEFLGRARIPHSYFVDDSFQTLRREEPAFWAYSAARYRKMLAGVDCVLVTSPPLAEELGALHPRVTICGLCRDRDLVAAESADDESALGFIRAAVPGGRFRAADFHRGAGPALVGLQAERPASLIVSAGCGFAGLTVPTRVLDREASFRRFIAGWRSERPTVLLQPRAATANDRYKSPNALLVALYLGVPLIVAAGEPAYDGLSETDGVFSAASADDWRRRIIAAHEPRTRRGVMTALAATCEARFSGDEQLTALRAFLAGTAALTPDLLSFRHSAAASAPVPILASRLPRAVRSTMGRAWHRARSGWSFRG